MTPDMYNALFEMFGGLLKIIDIVALYRHKEVKGISMLPVYFFVSWAAFNCWFYPSIGQYWSFIGGLFLFAANGIWVIMALYYKHSNQDLRTPTL